MTPRRGAACAALLLFVALPLSIDGISATAYGGWPAIGFSAALFLVAGREHARATFVAQSVVVTVGLTVGYDIGMTEALPGSLTVTLPALLTVSMLGWGFTRPNVRLDMIDSDRYHLVTAFSALACAGLGGIAVLLTAGPRDALLATLMSFLAALSAQLVVLPLVIGESVTPPVAGRGELIAQRILLLSIGGSLLWFETSGAMLFVLFTVLGWAARRSTPREAHVQLFLVSTVAYALALVGRGPLVSTPTSVSSELGPAIFYLFVISACYLVVPITLASEELVSMARRATRAATTVERLFDSAVGTVLLAVDEHGMVTHFNSGAQRALGYEVGDVMGRSPAMLCTQEELARQAQHFGVAPTPWLVALAHADSGERREWSLTRKDGAQRTLALSVSTVQDVHGHTVGMIASGEDISERLRGEQALASALERELASVRALQRVDRVKEDLISTVSHELRTPITSIAGYAELLADGLLGPLTEEQTDALARIEGNTARLGTLVQDLLTMSRSETDQLELDCRRVDLRVVARDAFETLRELMGARQLLVELRVPEHPVPVLGDRVALGRVTENLLTNALKFTPDGGAVTVSVRQDSFGEGALTVADTGMGIPADDVPLLFDRFFRSSAATDLAIQGSGLGLSIVHAIVEQHGGRVDVDSHVGAGSTFTVRLPATQSETHAATPSEKSVVQVA